MSSNDTNPLLEWDNITWREPSSDRASNATQGFHDRIQERGLSRDWTGHLDSPDRERE